MSALLSLSAAQYLLLAGQFLTGPLLARALGPDGRGELAVILVLYTLLPAVLGLGSQARYRRAVASNASVVASHVALRNAALLASLMSVPVVLAGLVALRTAGLFETVALVALLMTSGLANYRNAIVSGAIALGDTRPAAINSAVTGLATTVGIVGLFLTNLLTVQSATLMYALATILAFLIIPRTLSWQSGCARRPGLRYGLKSMAGQVGELAILRVDQILAAAILGLSGAGIYAVGWSFAYLAYPLLHSMAISATAAKTRTIRGKTNQFKAKWRNAIAMVLCLGALFFSAPTAIPLLFGSDFSASAAVAQILLVAMFLMSIVTGLLQTNMSSGRTIINGIAATLGICVTVSLALAFGNLIGPPGIAVASTIGIGSCLLVLVAASHNVDDSGKCASGRGPS